MNLSEKQLEEIEAYALALMKPSEICIILELNQGEFEAQLDDSSSMAYKAFYKGFLKSKYELNKKIIDLAKAGSSPAQTIANKLVMDTELDLQ